MKVLTGNGLKDHRAAGPARFPVQKLWEYLKHGKGVCILQGSSRVGKADALWQSIRCLIEEGISADDIIYLSQEPEDIFDELFMEIGGQPKQRYIFINGYDRLYDSLGFGYCLQELAETRKMVLCGDFPLILHQLELYDWETYCGDYWEVHWKTNWEVIRFPYLNYYEHCRFMLRRDTPDPESLLDYLQWGGLNVKCEDAVDYLKTDWADSVVRLYKTQLVKYVSTWLPADDENDSQWLSYLTSIMKLACGDESQVEETIVHDFRNYFAHPDRRHCTEWTETTMLLHTLLKFGVLLEWSEGDERHCSIGVPFLHFHFARKDESLQHTLLEAVLRRECPEILSMSGPLLEDNLGLIAQTLYRAGEELYHTGTETIR